MPTLRQGITTEFLGIDGMSYAPLSPANYRAYRHWLSGLLGHPPDDLDMSSVTAFRGHYHRKVAVNTCPSPEPHPTRLTTADALVRGRGTPGEPGPGWEAGQSGVWTGIASDLTAGSSPGVTAGGG